MPARRKRRSWAMEVQKRVERRSGRQEYIEKEIAIEAGSRRRGEDRGGSGRLVGCGQCRDGRQRKMVQ